MSSGAEQKKPVKKLALVRDAVKTLGVRSGIKTGLTEIIDKSRDFANTNTSHPSSHNSLPIIGTSH